MEDKPGIFERKGDESEPTRDETITTEGQRGGFQDKMTYCAQLPHRRAGKLRRMHARLPEARIREGKKERAYRSGNSEELLHEALRRLCKDDVEEQWANFCMGDMDDESLNS